MSGDDSILSARDGAIASVTLNRPQKLNALTQDMRRQLAEAMRALSSDDEVRCVIIRGAGGRAFCSGDDITEFGAGRATPGQAKADTASTLAAVEAVRDCRHPVVALIEGVCAGGGLALAMACDIRVCSQSSRFGFPIKKLGLTLPHAVIETLLSLVGPARTLELLLEGEMADAGKALAMGLVNHMFADGEAAAQAEAVARRIAEGAPLAARWHKKFVRQLLGGGMLGGGTLTEAELDEAYAYAATEDFRAGLRAFLQKKKPEFEGR